MDPSEPPQFRELNIQSAGKRSKALHNSVTAPDMPGITFGSGKALNKMVIELTQMYDIKQFAGAKRL